MIELEKLIKEKFELKSEVERLKRKLIIRESALAYIMKEIDLQLNTEEDEENCLHNRKAFCDI
ncbi:hypothetical protein [uncultured Clostridium sp.]|uniref:hypothetical protein n=1 Tax=uncultured Clostridium sp. TaxID=59620 RepID=UPI002636D719|nr:hypothetical protein [uncultured Clostridium sp.]